jgi:tetratricopeptide (TPR) repeat protein
MGRIDQLLSFVQEDPHDPFNVYAVALEYLKLDTAKAVEFFEVLVAEHADYIPTYYTYGKLLQERKDFSKAKSIFERGIEKALKKNDAKTVSELRNALSMLEFEMNDG